MTQRITVALVLVLLCLAGCSAITGSNPPLYYGVDYPYKQQAACSSGFKEGLRIWSFSASSPFDHEEMIVLSPAHEVHFSPRYRWISPPGNMVADAIHRDLARSGLFPQIVETGDPFNVPLEMGGHIYQFAWEEGGKSTARAVLDVEVNLWRKEPKREVLFRKHYHFKSEPVSKLSSERFADAMSGLVAKMSEALEQDLCQVAISKGN